MKKILNLIKNKEIHKNPPVWIMRQAGRYLPEYLEIRKNCENFLDLCYNPKLASEVTIQPISRFDLDAAIIFSDILVIPDALGVDVKFVKNEGPKLSKTLNKNDLVKLNQDNLIRHLEPVFENLSLTKSRLPQDKTLIGFSGAPFTLACYMIEGGGSKNFDSVKRAAIQDESFFSELIEILTESVSTYLIHQINAGADIIKIFDSWAGILPDHQIRKWVFDPVEKIIQNVKKTHPETPIISFPRAIGTFYEEYAQKINCDVLAIDQNLSYDFVTNKLQNHKIIQGNLDNQLLAFGSKSQIETEVNLILEKFNKKPFIFNLGHGIIKETPIENVEFLMKLIRK